MLESNLISSLTFYPFSSLVPCTIKCPDGVELRDIFNDYCDYTFGGLMRNTYMHPTDFRKAIRECLLDFNLAAPEIENLMAKVQAMQDKEIFVALDK
jgi:hypothetical protein